MRPVRWSLSVVAVIGVTAVVIAVTTIWLLATDPIKTADSISNLAHGDAAPFAAAIGSVLVNALRGLFKYL